MKWLGLLCLFLCCTGAGLLASRKLSADTAVVHKLLALLEYTENHIRYEQLPLAEIFQSARNVQTFSGLDFLQTLEIVPDRHFSESWTDAVQKDGRLPERAAAVLLELGNTLGTTDADGQVSSIAFSESVLKTLETECYETGRQKGELYRRLGMLAGMLLVLLLL